MMTVSEAAKAFLACDRYLILTHRNPDGDTVGSASAFCRGLRALGKSAYLYRNPQITKTYLPFAEPLFAPEGYVPDVTVAVDVADVRMYPNGYTGRPEYCIDHHGSNPGFAGETCLMAHKASCGEAVLEILKAMNAPIDRDMADALYAAVSTDCGAFQYRNTTADTLRAAAELIELGADHAALNKKLFRTFSRGRLTLEGMVYTTMRQYRDGTLNVAAVSLKMLEEAGAAEEDMDDLASLAGKLAGVEASVTLREMAGGMVKASVRTNGNPDASKVCAKFGGGGHVMASGCSMECTLEEAEARIVAAMLEEWQ